MPVVIKSSDDVATMREAGRVVATVLREVGHQARPGRSTKDLDDIAEATTLKFGAKPSFKGLYGFPASVCISLNDEVVHGIPRADRVLVDGDIVSLDFGAMVRGLHADAAITVAVGAVSDDAQRLLDVTEQSLWRAINQLRPGRRIGDVSWAVQSYVESQGYSVVRKYVGHAVGRDLHEQPQVPNHGSPGRGMALRRGMTLAIEPMVNAGTAETSVLDDNWTVVTADRTLSAHFEHTVAVTEGEPLVLTLP